MRGELIYSVRPAWNVHLKGSRIPIQWSPHLRLAAALDAHGHFRRRHAREYSLSKRLGAPVTFTKPSLTPYQSVPSCPEPTCECAATPSLREPIDRQANIRESAPGYVHHVVISTGKSDWSSRIEDEGKLDREVRRPPPPSPKDRFKSIVKRILGRGGLRHSSERSRNGMREVGLARGLRAELGRKGAYFDVGLVATNFQTCHADIQEANAAHAHHQFKLCSSSCSCIWKHSFSICLPLPILHIRFWHPGYGEGP